MDSAEARERGVLLIEQGGHGGVADYTAELAHALADRGWTVELGTATDHMYEPHPGVTVHKVFPYFRGSSRAWRAMRRVRLTSAINALRFLLAIPRLARLARRTRLVHCQGWELAPLGVPVVAAMRLAGATVVQTSHNTFERGAMSFERTHRALGSMAARTIVHTQADVPALLEPASRRAVVIPHGEYGGLARTGGTADRDEARSGLGLPDGAPTALLFGQIRWDKGLPDLLAAASRLPELHLIIGGEDKGALVAAADQLAAPELEGRVIVREGYLSMADAAKLFAAADTSVLPYEKASQSGVLLLSYGFGRPVVVYPVGGLPEAVAEGETGWVCARADVDALTDALRQTIEAGWEECRRRGLAGARLAHERYSWSQIARLTEEVYLDALGVRADVPALAASL